MIKNFFKNIERKYGTTRAVLLIGQYAIKVPSFVEWRLFLYGLLGNMQEVVFWKGLPTSRSMMCPVLFSIPGGFLIIMRRAESVSVEEFLEKSQKWFNEARNLSIPVENKVDSWGRINNKIVAVDYGSSPSAD